MKFRVVQASGRWWNVVDESDVVHASSHKYQNMVQTCEELNGLQPPREQLARQRFEETLAREAKSRSQIITGGIHRLLLTILVCVLPALMVPKAWPWYLTTPIVMVNGFTMAWWFRRVLERTVDETLKLARAKAGGVG